MRTKTLLVALVGALTIIGLNAPALAQPHSFGRWQAPSPFEGSWVVSIRPIFCSGPTVGTDVPGIPPVVSHLTFACGGSMTESTSNPHFGPGKRGSGHGWWERTGATSYQFAFQAFLLEPTSPYKTGLQRIEQTVELHTGDEWTSSGPVQFFETFDLSTAPGLAPCRAGCARASGVRMY